MTLQENIIRIKEVMGIYTSDQNIIVEASKKEILIDKLGFSNENAEVLANAAGPFSVWLGNKLINDGAFEYSKEYLNKVGIMNHVLSKITSIMDWIRVGLNGNAKPYQNMFFEQLYELSKEWHDSLKFGEGDFNYKEKNKILQDYRDENGIGFYWVDLGTNSSDEECNRMGHCGETALGNSLYSLRSTQRFTKDFTLNKSYLTVDVGEKDGLIYQIKGPKNSKPNKKYHPYIVDLILNNDHIQGFGRGSIVYDFRITDLPKQEIIKVYSKKPELFNTKELKNYLKNELGDESADPNDVSVEDKSLQENIIRIKQVMGLNEQYPEGIDPKDLEALEVPIDNVEPEETPNQEEPKDSDDFSNSVVPQIVWRAGRVGSSPKGGGIWFGETKKDVENFAWSVRDERREGLPYYINLQNPRYYKNFWNDYLIKAKGAGRDVLMNALMNAGYDGIIIDTDTWNDTADEYAVTSKQFIVFDPKNVKPA